MLKKVCPNCRQASYEKGKAYLNVDKFYEMIGISPGGVTYK